MHEHSLVRMFGYVVDYFANSEKPVHPWSLHLNFNHKHQSFEQLPEHFIPDGVRKSNVSAYQQIEAIDPGWKVKGSEPVFEESDTKKKLKISSHGPGKAETHEPIIITGKRNNVVMISQEDWNAIEETLYLNAIPNMASSIQDSMNAPDSEFSKNSSNMVTLWRIKT